MKKYNIISSTLIMFASSVIVGMFVSSILNGFEFHMGYQFLIVSIITTVLRYIFYSEEVIKKKSYTFRNICFFAVLLPILFTLGMSWDWFPKEIGPIITFIIIFFVIGISISTYCYFKMKKEGFRYTKSLDEYKTKFK